MAAMSAASSIAVTPKAPRQIAALADRPLWLALAIVALVTAVRMTGTVDSDVAWQLWIAGRIHAGANLYTDIIETNPPLWFWMALPVDRLSVLLHVRVEAVLVAAIGLAAAVSIFATDRLMDAGPAGRRLSILAYAALTLVAMPWVHTGQREQIALIGALPYVALIAARRDDRPVSLALAIAVGLGAGLGLALKHYFLAVPMMLELWLLAAQGRRWRPVRPETSAMVFVGIAYAASIIAIEPDFLTRILPLLRLAYGVYGPPSVEYLFGPLAILALLIIAIAAAILRDPFRKDQSLAGALLIAALGFAAAYFIQFKGWNYHAIPMLGCGSLALAVLLSSKDRISSVLRICGPVVLALPAVFALAEQRHPPLPNRDLRQALAGLAPDEPVGFLTEETAIPWSVTLQGRYRYASRYNGFWMLNAIVGNELKTNPDPKLAALGRQVVTDTVADFSCIVPRRIIVPRPRPGQAGFDILPFFQRDPAFVALLSHYKERSRTSLDTFELTSAVPPGRGQCRHGV
jgi:hypothetical protein